MVIQSQQGWKSAAFDPSSGSNGRPKQPYKAPPKPKNKRQQVNEQIASMKIIKQEMDIDVPQDQVIHDLTNAPSPSPSTSPLSSHTDALSESNDMTGNGAGFRYSPNGDIDLTMDEDGCVDLTASSPPIDLTEDEPTDYHANHGRRPSHEANAMRNEAGGRREPSPTNSLFDDDEEALSREREEQEERRTVTRTRMEDEALMNAQRANLFGTRDDATVNSVDGDVSGISSNITPKPGLTFPVIKKGRKRALDVTEESSIPSTSLDSTPTPASKRTKHLGHGKSSRTTTSLFTAVKGKAVVRDRTGVVRHFDVLSSAGTRLASDTASERAINAQLDQFNDRDRVTRAAAAPIAHTYGAYSGNPDDLEEYDEDEEMVDAEGQQSSTNGLSDLNQYVSSLIIHWLLPLIPGNVRNVDNREGDRSLSPGADAIRKQKWGAVQPKEE